MLYTAQGLTREQAIWETPEHVGWQILHAHEIAEGRPRQWVEKIRSGFMGKIESFRDRQTSSKQIDPHQEKDNLEI